MMKKNVFLLSLLSVLMIVSMSSCQENDNAPKQIAPISQLPSSDSLASILPQNTRIDIPSSVSSSGNSNNRISSTNTAKLDGNSIYENLRTFINVGETSTDILQSMFTLINQYKLYKDTTFNFTGDTGRAMTLSVKNNPTLTSGNYEYQIVFSTSGDTIIQMLWNRTPARVVSVMNPYLFDLDTKLQGAMYKIDYSESDTTYDKTMLVGINGLNATDTFDIAAMKMFVGQKGDVLDITGNTSHPNFMLIDSTFTGGRHYAFVGRAHQTQDYGVAEVALPTSALTTSDSVLEKYSIYSVFRDEIMMVHNDTSVIDKYLSNAKAPGFFQAPNGFLQSGTSPGSPFTSDFIDLTSLKPFVPKEVDDEKIIFIR